MRNLRVSVPMGEGGTPRLIPLSKLATIRVEDGPAQISRDNISRRISVETHVWGKDQRAKLGLASFVGDGPRGGGAPGQSVSGLEHPLGRAVREPSPALLMSRR
jgi:hypothetical protein